MALSIAWGTKTINILQADLTFVSGTLYELDTDAFRLELKDIEDSELGMPFDDTHIHNTEVSVAGTTYARFVEIANGFNVTFEDTGGQYSVRLAGSNNNIFDVENAILNPTDKVTVIGQNAAGLIVVGPGTILETEKEDIASKVWDKETVNHNTEGTFGYLIQTTIPTLISSIAAAISKATLQTIKTVTGTQPNQK